MTKTLLPSYYLPPISWFAAMKSGEPTAIEQWENFHKQTLRNRCYIDSPNGRLALSVPIDKTNFNEGGKCIIKDVRISHQFDWQHQHWQAFETSYDNSPFFDYLKDDFRPIYEKEWEYLIDLNETLTEKCLELLELENKPVRTESYQGLTIQEKDLPMMFPSKEYYQVYRHKHPFLADLSIFDLLMNMGPESILYL